MAKKQISKFKKMVRGFGLGLAVIAGLTALNYADYKWFDKLNPFYSEPEAPQISQESIDALNKNFNESTAITDSPRIGGSNN